MDHVDAKRYHVTPFRRDWHCVLKVPVPCWKMGCARSTVWKFDHVLTWSLFMRAIQETDTSIGIVCVVQMNQAIYKSAILMLVKSPVLMHWKWMPCRGWLGMQRRMMQFDVRPNQIRHCARKLWMRNCIAPGS